jgi:hypothetical protein
MTIKINTNVPAERQIAQTFKELGFTTFKAFREVLKMDKSITLLNACNCWDGHPITPEVANKIKVVIEIIKEGEHPLEYIVNGEFFTVDNAYQSIGAKGVRTIFYTKKVGDATYTTLSVEILKSLCDNHKDTFKHGLTGSAMGYGRGKNQGD